MAGSSLILLPAADAVAEDAGEAVQGTLRDQGVPVEGVVIVVTETDGSEVGSATSDAEGGWLVALPGPGTYAVELDEDTLPDDLSLRDPDKNPLEIAVGAGQERGLIFAIGSGSSAGPSFVKEFTRATVNGLKFGLIIAMCTIGLSLIFGTTGLVNFAHGELVTIGAVLTWYIADKGPPLIAAGVAAILLTAAFGGGLEWGLWRPLRRRQLGGFQLLVISIGLALLLRHVILLLFGADRRPYTEFVIQDKIELGLFSVTPRDLTIIVLSILVLLGVATMLQRTRIGKAMRAISDNRDLAESSGIDVQRVIMWVWALGAGLAALGGILLGVSENIDYLMGFRLLLLMFAAMILGGLGSAYGAMVGGILIGLATEIGTLWVAPELKVAIPLVVLILVLLLRPQGILGRRERVG